MSEGTDLEFVRRTMQAILVCQGGPIVLDDHAKGRRLDVAPDTAAAPDGLLPAFLVAAEALWREATGKGFELDIRRDSRAMLGYRVEAIGGASYATVMLSLLEAQAQASHRGAVIVNELGEVWREATERIERNQPPSPGVGPQAGPTP